MRIEVGKANYVDEVSVNFSEFRHFLTSNKVEERHVATESGNEKIVVCAVYGNGTKILKSAYRLVVDGGVADLEHPHKT